MTNSVCARDDYKKSRESLSLDQSELVVLFFSGAARGFSETQLEVGGFSGESRRALKLFQLKATEAFGEAAAGLLNRQLVSGATMIVEEIPSADQDAVLATLLIDARMLADNPIRRDPRKARQVSNVIDATVRAVRRGLTHSCSCAQKAVPA